VEQGEKLSRVLLRSYKILNFDKSLGRAAFCEILMLTWVAILGGILMFLLGRWHERHAVQRGIWVPTQHLLWDRTKSRKTLIDLAGRRTFRMRTDF
jgi:hypothetical protein